MHFLAVAPLGLAAQLVSVLFKLVFALTVVTLQAPRRKSHFGAARNYQPSWKISLWLLRVAKWAFGQNIKISLRTTGVFFH